MGSAIDGFHFADEHQHHHQHHRNMLQATQTIQTTEERGA
jgi:hypothetical protein